MTSVVRQFSRVHVALLLRLTAGWSMRKGETEREGWGVRVGGGEVGMGCL